MGRAFSTFLLAMLVAACNVGRLDLRVVHTVTEKPARVVVVYRVYSEGEPVLGIPPEAFEVTEDGRTVARGTQWHVTAPDVAERQYVGVLVDLSGTIPAAYKASLGKAVNAFVERLGPATKVVVYAYDGAAEPHAVFPTSKHASAGDALVAFEPNAEPVDLYSAYGTVVTHLSDILGDHALNMGSMVLIARTPDAAARTTLAAVDERAKKIGDRVTRYTIAVGASAGAEPSLAQLGNRPMRRVAKVDGVESALDEIADRHAAAATGLYVLSHCSLARAREHELQITATRRVPGPKGETKKRGVLVHHFSAEEFGAGCEPALPEHWGDRAPTRPPKVDGDVSF